MEGIGKEVFEEWMQRLMERIDRLDSIISVLINKESDVLEFISRNMEKVTLDGKKVLKVKKGTEKKAPEKTAKEKKEAEGIPGLINERETEAKRVKPSLCLD